MKNVALGKKRNSTLGRTQFYKMSGEYRGFYFYFYNTEHPLLERDGDQFSDQFSTSLHNFFKDDIIRCSYNPEDDFVLCHLVGGVACQINIQTEVINTLELI